MSTSPWISTVSRRIEGALFAHRRLWLALFALLTLLLGWQMLQLRPDASLQKMVPARHEFVLNYLKFENELRPLGNTLRTCRAGLELARLATS